MSTPPRALGFSHARIVLARTWCQRASAVPDPLSAFVGQAILAEASLSYLARRQEPVAAWGLMLQGMRGLRQTAPWIAISRVSPSC